MARIGLAVPPLIFSGRPMKRERPRAMTLSRLARHVAQTPTRLAALVVGGLGSGVFAVAATNPAPVFKARPAARLADGRSVGGAIIRVEDSGPHRLDRLHVLRGAGRVSRGTVLVVDGNDPVRWLQGVP